MSPIALRPVLATDESFLLAVYGSTRAAEMALVDWSDDVKAAFVRQQFDAQHRYYRQEFSGAAFQVIVVDGEPAGRLYVAEGADETKIIDIALLPAFQRRGVGTALLTGILARAAERAVAVTIHVERNNPARGWYDGLGFVAVDEGPVYSLLRWEPPAPAGPADDAPAATSGREP